MRAVVGLALHPVAAELVNRLRDQADVAADRNAALDQEAHGAGHDLPAFELDHLRTGRHQARGIGERLFGRAW